MNQRKTRGDSGNVNIIKGACILGVILLLGTMAVAVNPDKSITSTSQNRATPPPPKSLSSPSRG